MPQVAVFTSLFFVASLIHIPLGPAGVHLVLNGLVGIILGWAVFPAVFAGLLLQTIIFGHGGITVIGVNTFNMAFPGLISYWIYCAMKNKSAAGFLAGFTGVAGSLFLLMGALVITEMAFIPAAKLMVLSYIPIAGMEGIITAAAVGFILKTNPEMIQNTYAS